MLEPLMNGRRHFLQDSIAGLGGVALSWMMARENAIAAPSAFRSRVPGSASGAADGAEQDREAGGSLGHFPAKAKRAVLIFACGGVSHLDTFDYKPDLARLDGKELTGKGKIDPFFGKPGRLLRSPFAFRPRGQSGLQISDLLPHLAECADLLTVIRSMVAKSSNHTPAAFQMNTGFTMNGFPSLGAWLSYGLGTLNEELPTFVVLPDPRGLPAGGSIHWTSSFLPAKHQGAAFQTQGHPIPHLRTPSDVSAQARRAGLQALDFLNREHSQLNPGDSALSARIRSYELAAKMQASVPEAVDFSNEPADVRSLYGLDRETTAGFGRNCLLARRLLERGVRFVQLFHGGAFGSPRINWDAHEDLVQNHRSQAETMDQPLAGFLKDLKQRGMLDDTLVVWATEFGRTPFTEGIGGKGRDHHPLAFSGFMAGAGLKPGCAYGETDEVGYQVAESPVAIPDFHATILRILGLDHKRLTYYHNGIQRRLTDVSGDPIAGILA